MAIDRTKKRGKIFVTSINTITDRLGKFAGCCSQFAPGNFYFRNLFHRKKDIKLPLIGVSLNTISEAHDLMSVGAVKNAGVLGPKNIKYNYQIKYFLTPVRVELRFVYFTQSQLDVINFTQSWIDQENELSFCLQAKAGDQSKLIAIKALPTKELTTPELEFSPTGDMFALEGTLQLLTYINKVSTVPLVQKIQGKLYSGESEQTDPDPILLEEYLVTEINVIP